jgi:acetyl-CoA acetyltransferase
LVLDELAKRVNINPAMVDDVIFGCVSQIGAQSGNLARMAVLASKTFPESVPGTTVDRYDNNNKKKKLFRNNNKKHTN